MLFCFECFVARHARASPHWDTFERVAPTAAGAAVADAAAAGGDASQQLRIRVGDPAAAAAAAAAEAAVASLGGFPALRLAQRLEPGY